MCMRFADITGQSALIEQLSRTGRTAHAQLLLGPEGCGKLALAWAYAQYLLCTNPTEGDACGTCAACRKVQKLIHPDLHFSFPTIGSKQISDNFLKPWRESLLSHPYLRVNDWLGQIGTGQQGNITKDECIHIVKKLSLKSFEGGYKILIMWMPEFLGKEGNRLLKLIEEPPEKTVFLLVAEQSEKILNTILSRCQLLHVPRLSDESVQHILEEEHRLSRDQALQIARISDGNIARAIDLIDTADTEITQAIIDWLRTCYKGHGKDLVAWVDTMAGGKRKDGHRYGRRDQVFFLQYAIQFLRECLMLKATGEARLQEQERKAATGITQLMDFAQMEALNGVLSDCAYYIERNGNAKIVLLDTSIQIHYILRPRV